MISKELQDYRTPFPFLADVYNTTKKKFIGEHFDIEIDNLCQNKNLYIITLDIDKFYDDEMNYPLFLSDKNCVFRAFQTFNTNPYEYTINNGFKTRIIGDRLDFYDTKKYTIDDENIIEVDYERWEGWKVEYEAFFKLVWLLDEYFKNGGLSFPMGLRKVQRNHPVLGPIKNKLAIHPGGTRQVITRVMGGKQKFITTEEDKLDLLKDFIVDKVQITDYVHFKKLIDKRIDLSNSFIIEYDTNGYKEYEFNINAYNHINYVISIYAKKWFEKFQNIDTVELIGTDLHKEMYKKLDLHWNVQYKVPSKIIYEKIKFVDSFSKESTIKVKLSDKNKIVDILMIPYLIGSDLHRLVGKNGFTYEHTFSENKLEYTFEGFKDGGYNIDNNFSEIV
jgi:hypothetical protein